MSQDRLAFSQVALLVAYAVRMAGGQMLFKAAALRYASDAPPIERGIEPCVQCLLRGSDSALHRPHPGLGMAPHFYSAFARLPICCVGLRDHAAAWRSGIRRTDWRSTIGRDRSRIRWPAADSQLRNLCWWGRLLKRPKIQEAREA
jgi:hypothetical protein